MKALTLPNYAHSYLYQYFLSPIAPQGYHPFVRSRFLQLNLRKKATSEIPERFWDLGGLGGFYKDSLKGAYRNSMGVVVRLWGAPFAEVPVPSAHCLGILDADFGVALLASTGATACSGVCRSLQGSIKGSLRRLLQGRVWG